jgi:hypothetical protein
MANIHAQLTDRETQLAEDMTRVLDWLSRVIHGLDTGNLRYAEEKAAALIERVEQLDMHLQAAVNHAGREAAVRPDKLRAAITEFARHYAAGRALYPARE